MFQYYIIDDNIFYRDDLKKALQKLNINKKVLEINSAVKINELINNTVIKDSDVFFIDIDMKLTINGIDLAEKIRNKNNRCHIVFFSYHSTHGIGIDIINKNIYPVGYINNDADLLKELQHVLQQIKWKETIMGHTDKIVFSKNGITTVFYPNEIAYVEGIKNIRNKVMVKNAQKDRMLNLSLKEVKKKFEDRKNFLILKSYCINLDQVTSVDLINFVITFQGDLLLPVGRKIAEQVKTNILNNNLQSQK